MSVVGKKIRVYDLARELKQDTKRIIEELRCEGAEVLVPSDSVLIEIAEIVRNKYFPRKYPKKRCIKVIKSRGKDVIKIPTKTSRKLVKEEIIESVKNCRFCRRLIDAQEIGEHQDKCEKNPQWIHFVESVPERVFEKTEISHIPFPDNKKNERKMCQICGENFPMSSSNICYECKDK